jgi:hypothetical protein
LVALLRLAERDPRAESIYVGAPGANIKWSVARLASDAADMIEQQLIEPRPANDGEK